jgi:uncharacterized YigZ family protein
MFDMSSDRYLSIGKTGSAELVVKKSRFICTMARAKVDGDAREVIASMKKQYWDASHNCSAYVIGENGDVQRTSDDGEPSGTAGSPMLNVLLQRGLTDTVAVVTRYFGGTKLGAGGLIRAYGQAVSDAIDKIGMIERKELARIAVVASFDDAGRLEHALRTDSHEPVDVSYGEQVWIVVDIEPADVPQFTAWAAELTSGRATVESRGAVHTEVPYTFDTST